MTMKPLFVLGWTLLCAAAPVRALEISLEENRAQRGNIGYVDIQKIFQLYPETKKTKQSFSEVVHQAEEQVNLKKADLLALRGEIAKLNLEHDLLIKTPIAAAPGPEPAPELPAPTTGQLPAATSSITQPPSQSTVTLPTPALAAATTGTISLPASSVSLPSSTAPAAGVEQSVYSQLPGMSHAASGEPPRAPAAPTPTAETAPQRVSSDTSKEPLVINIPGASNTPIVVQPPPATAAGGLSGSTTPVSATVARGAVPQQLPSTEVGAAPQQRPEAALPRENARSAAPGLDSAQRRNLRLKQLEDEIAAKIEDLARKEAEFKDYQAQVEKNLTGVENRRSEMLLAQIYNAVRSVARENGVSVIVDKSQIVFGHDTVDLTDKVIKKLRESQP